MNELALHKTTSIPIKNVVKTVMEPSSKANQSDSFSFKDYAPKSTDRPTLINNLTYSSQPSSQPNNKTINYNSYNTYNPALATRTTYRPIEHHNYSPPKHPQSVYVEPAHEINYHPVNPINFSPPKVSLKNVPPLQPFRSTSPAVSPRAVNFSYQNGQRFTSPSPHRTSYVTSRRYWYLLKLCFFNNQSIFSSFIARFSFELYNWYVTCEFEGGTCLVLRLRTPRKIISC